MAALAVLFNHPHLRELSDGASLGWALFGVAVAVGCTALYAIPVLIVVASVA